MENNKAVLFELNIENNRCIFPNTISNAIIDANEELKDLEGKLTETLETIRLLTPECISWIIYCLQVWVRYVE